MLQMNKKKGNTRVLVDDVGCKISKHGIAFPLRAKLDWWIQPIGEEGVDCQWYDCLRIDYLGIR